MTLLAEIYEALTSLAPQVLFHVKSFVLALARGDSRAARVSAAEAINFAARVAVREQMKREKGQ